MREVLQYKLHWKPAFRVIPTRYPEINLYERVTAAADLKAVQSIEAFTNNRERLKSGAVSFLRATDHLPKNCSRDVLTSFAYRSNGRFTKAELFGAFYAALNLKTAVFEKAYHQMQFLTDARWKRPVATQMRVIKSEIKATVYDIRRLQKRYPRLYHPTHYLPSQEWAHKRWLEGAEGIASSSVRNPGGECAAIFSPQTITHCRKDIVLTYTWDGARTMSISPVHEYFRFERAE